MFILKKFGCRVFQVGFRMALPFLPYREPQILDSCEKLGLVVKKENIRSILIVTDNGIVKNGLVEPLKKILKKNKVSYTIYDKTQPIGIPIINAFAQ